MHFLALCLFGENFVQEWPIPIVEVAMPMS